MERGLPKEAKEKKRKGKHLLTLWCERIQTPIPVMSVALLRWWEKWGWSKRTYDRSAPQGGGGFLAQSTFFIVDLRSLLLLLLLFFFFVPLLDCPVLQGEKSLCVPVIRPPLQSYPVPLFFFSSGRRSIPKRRRRHKVDSRFSQRVLPITFTSEATS